MVEYAIIGVAALVIAGLLVFLPKLKGTKFEKYIGYAKLAAEVIEQDFKFKRKEDETPEEAEQRRAEMHAAGIEQLKKVLKEAKVKIPSDEILNMLMKAGVYAMNITKNLLAKES